MKRMCVAPLCIAVLVMRNAASAQENGSVKPDEFARTSLDCNRQNSMLCQPVAQAQRVGNQAEVQPGSTRGKDLPAAHDLELQEIRPAPRNRQKRRRPQSSNWAPAPIRSRSGGGWTVSPTVAAEVTPIENWLELEFGVTPTFSHHSTEWDTDLLFKKPWTLSRKVEFMFGVGPEWIHIRKNGITTNSVAGEIALDFMFWPSRARRFGWYIEPAYDYTFGRGHDQAIGVSIGLLISIH
jgi:hypothetical protein